MNEQIVNGVLLQRDSEVGPWYTTTQTGQRVNFVPRFKGGWSVRYGDPLDGEDDGFYYLLADAVQAVRSKGWRLPGLTPNAVAIKGIEGAIHGWYIYREGDSRHATFIHARGRVATVSDLYRRANVAVPEHRAEENHIAVRYLG